MPILSGGAGYFTNVTGGQAQLNPKTSPVLLLPIGDRWLIESRREFEGDFRRTGGTGAYAARSTSISTTSNSTTSPTVTSRSRRAGS